MKDRKPFKIEPIIVAYNVIMVILSAGFFIEDGRLTYFDGKMSLICEAVDYSENENAVSLARVGWWFLLMKIVEFTDTVLFVLKKNNHQVSNLHVFHHSSVVLGSYIGVRYAPISHGSFFPFINCLVHVVMYTYYLLSAMGPNVRKHLWWKKYLTQFQMVSELNCQFMPRLNCFFFFFFSESIHHCWYTQFISFVLRLRVS